MIAHCNKIHICDSCTYQYPNCGADNIVFGCGKGNDNVIDCDIFCQGDNESITCPSGCTYCDYRLEEQKND